MALNAIEIYRKAFWDGLRPTQPMSVWQWADKHRVLSSKSSPEPGLWRTSRVPYMREIMEKLSVDDLAQWIVFQKAAQIGATEVGYCWMGYVIDHVPGPMMVVQPTKEVMERNVRLKIDPMIEASPALKNKIPPKKSREGGNNTEGKTFPGGALIFSGANSSSSVKSVSVRFLMLDEIDEYQADLNDQGDTMDVIEQRTNAFGAKAKIYVPSTPTVEGKSKIAKLFDGSDKRYYMMPCPHCRSKIKYIFSQLKCRTKKDPETVWYVCQECDQGIEEWQKTQMLEDGLWVATAKSHYIGYHLSALYSPVGWHSWKRIMRDWFNAQGNQQKLKTFANTTLGETWKESSDAPDWKRLYERRETYKLNVVPMRACVLTAFCDVQKNRLEVEIMAWGRNAEHWSIDYRVFEGDTSNLEADCWNQLKNTLEERYKHESGVEVSIDKMGVDCGYNTNTVYNFARRFDPTRLLAVKGSAARVAVSPPRKVDVRDTGKRVTGGIQQWSVGTDIIKSEIYAWLRQVAPKEEGAQLPSGWAHFPEYDQEYFEQLCAEQVTIKKVKGYTKYMWEKTRERNEALDTHVGNRALSILIGIDRWREEQWQAREKSWNVEYSASEVPRPVVVGARADAEPEPKQKPNTQFWGEKKKSFWDK